MGCEVHCHCYRTFVQGVLRMLRVRALLSNIIAALGILFVSNIPEGGVYRAEQSPALYCFAREL